MQRKWNPKSHDWNRTTSHIPKIISTRNDDHEIRGKWWTRKFLSSRESRLSIPYRTGRYGRNIPYQLAIRYTRPPCFVREKIPAVLASYRPYRPISGNTGRYRAYQPVQKKVFLFYFILIFVIFKFLLGQNGNLFALTY